MAASAVFEKLISPITIKLRRKASRVRDYRRANSLGFSPDHTSSPCGNDALNPSNVDNSSGPLDNSSQSSGSNSSDDLETHAELSADHTENPVHDNSSSIIWRSQSTLQGTLNITTVPETQTSLSTPPLTPVQAVHPATSPPVSSNADFTASVSDSVLVQAQADNTVIPAIDSMSDETLMGLARLSNTGNGSSPPRGSEPEATPQLQWAAPGMPPQRQETQTPMHTPGNSAPDTTAQRHLAPPGTAHQHREATPHPQPHPSLHMSEPHLIYALNKLYDKMDTIAATNNELADRRDENRYLKVKIAALQGELKAMNKLVEERSNELAVERSLKANHENAPTDQDTPQNQSPPKADPVLVVGSSILRDLDENLYSNTQVDAVSGATPGAITKLLQNHKAKGKNFSQVIILAGGNQLNYDESESDHGIDETISAMKATVMAAQELSSKVSVCELPPRTHKDCAADVISRFNGRLTEIACDIIPTQDNFYLADGTPNDGYLDRDLIHLNIRGSAKLVKSMGLELRDPVCRNVVRSKAAYKNPRMQEPQSPKNPPRTRYTDVVRPQQKTSSARFQQKNPPPKPLTNQVPPPTQRQTSPAPPHAKKQNNVSPIKRPPPLQPEYDFCGYCGEPGHNHLTCRHGGPVTCNECGMKTHKKNGALITTSNFSARINGRYAITAMS